MQASLSDLGGGTRVRGYSLCHSPGNPGKLKYITWAL